jgi:hypothetical protein
MTNGNSADLKPSQKWTDRQKAVTEWENKIASDVLEALIALHAVASVECDEDYAAVTNAAAVIAKVTGA